MFYGYAQSSLQRSGRDGPVQMDIGNIGSSTGEISGNDKSKKQKCWIFKNNVCRSWNHHVSDIAKIGYDNVHMGKQLKRIIVSRKTSRPNKTKTKYSGWA